MTQALVCATREEAERHVTALGRCSRYTDGGRPPLPRCDSGRWGDSQVRQGRRCPPCPCTSREAPDPSCPYVTRDDAPIIALRDGTYAVPVTRTHEAARGERVTVDGREVTITDAGARTITAAEREDTRTRDPEPDAPTRTR